MPAYQASPIVALAVVVALLSIGPVMNMLSPRQMMNASFDPLHLVNTYGAFGSITRERYEIVLEGTDDDDGHRHARSGASTSSRASPAIPRGGRRRWRRITCGSTG